MLQEFKKPRVADADVGTGIIRGIVFSSAASFFLICKLRYQHDNRWKLRPEIQEHCAVTEQNYRDCIGSIQCIGPYRWRAQICAQNIKQISSGIDPRKARWGAERNITGAKERKKRSSKQRPKAQSIQCNGRNGPDQRDRRDPGWRARSDRSRLR